MNINRIPDEVVWGNVKRFNCDISFDDLVKLRHSCDGNTQFLNELVDNLISLSVIYKNKDDNHYNSSIIIRKNAMILNCIFYDIGLPYIEHIHSDLLFKIPCMNIETNEQVIHFYVYGYLKDIKIMQDFDTIIDFQYLKIFELTNEIIDVKKKYQKSLSELTLLYNYKKDSIKLIRDLINQLKDLMEKKSKLIEDKCTICLEQYSEDDNKITTECNHTFHEECYMKWISHKNTCPLCRKQLISEAEDDSELELLSPTSNNSNESSFLDILDDEISTSSSEEELVEHESKEEDIIVSVEQYNQNKMRYLQVLNDSDKIGLFVGTKELYTSILKERITMNLGYHVNNTSDIEIGNNMEYVNRYLNVLEAIVEYPNIYNICWEWRIMNRYIYENIDNNIQPTFQVTESKFQQLKNILYTYLVDKPIELTVIDDIIKLCLKHI